MKKPKSIFFWITDIDVILKGDKPPIAIGGANLQMAFWAKTFASKGWKVYTFTYNKNRRTDEYGIHYLYFPLIRYVMFILVRLRYLLLYFKKPDVIITRGHPADLIQIQKTCAKQRIKLCHMLASDADVDIEINNFGPFQHYIKKANFVIAQNKAQIRNYKLNFNNRDIPLIPNIWDSSIFNNDSDYRNNFEIVWIGNFKSLKRPEWVLKIAKELPNFRFTMIGAAQDKKLFDKCVASAKGLSNLNIIGYKSLFEVDAILRNTKLLLCTSEYEGFPNTFLHAWSLGVPIVSTVDPNQSLSKNGLGLFATEVEDLKENIVRILSDEEVYYNIQKKVKVEFIRMHNPSSHYETMVAYLNGN